MSEATVRAAINTLVSGVANTGNVYDLEPFASNWDIFLDRFKATISSVDMVRGFTISCEAINSERMVAAGARNSIVRYAYTYRIRGYQGFDYDTSTEKAFLIVVLAVMAALDGGIVSGDIYNAELAQLEIYQPRSFGGLLCHYAEITQVVYEQI